MMRQKKMALLSTATVLLGAMAVGCQTSGPPSGGDNTSGTVRERDQTERTEGNTAVREQTQVRETPSGATVRETETQKREVINPGPNGTTDPNKVDSSSGK